MAETIFDWYTPIDQQVEEQWSKVKCKWFFGKLRKERLREKILYSNGTYTIFGPIKFIITTDEEN